MAETSPQATDDPPTRKRGFAFLRHPVVVGAALALISGLIASVLLPAVTRSWQDRPRELALKRDLVTDVSEEATAALERGNIFAYRNELERTSKAERIQNLTRQLSDWEVASSGIGSQLATYFGKTTLPKQWAAYHSAVSLYIEFTSHANEKYHPETGVTDHFRSVRFDDTSQEELRKQVVSTPNGSLNRIVGLQLLGYERDQIARRILAEDAAGFSHGFWIFGASGELTASRACAAHTRT
jgi:hypothetical protein